MSGHRPRKARPSNRKTILVTGGCGFIGSHFVRLLCAQRQFRVINLDKLTYAGNLDNLADIQDSDYRFIRGDIVERELIEKILREEKPWAVVNFAAESHVDRSILDSVPFLQTNTLGAQVLLEGARKHPVRRFLQVSTDEVYGDRLGKVPSDETSVLLPSSPYAASKAAADLLCLAYRRTYDMPILVTRSSNNYGPNQFPEKLIPLLIHNALSGMKLPVYGDGRQVRDWLYVEDNCRAILAVLNHGQPGAIYNVGTGEESTNLKTVRVLCKVIAQEAGLELQKLESNIEFIADRPGHDRRYALKTDKIMRDFGWSPSTTFERGARSTVRWYLEHQDWVARVTSGDYRDYYDAVYSRGWSKHSR